MEGLEVPASQEHSDLALPQYATSGSVGCDLPAAVEGEIRLEPSQRMLVPTGVRIALPPGVEAQIRPRSGLARDFGVTVLNAPGTIDSDYRGEIMVLLINLGSEAVRINRGDRIAQLVVSQTARAEWRPDLPIGETDRLDRGFGHSGSI